MRNRAQVLNSVRPLGEWFLATRVKALRKKIAGVLNLNPFLLQAIQGITSMQSQLDMATFMWNWHIAHGYATAFAKAVDEKILPAAFMTDRCDKHYREEHGMQESCFDDVDHLVHRADGTYLLSLKASAWTIQHGQAMGMYGNFKEIGEQGRREAGVIVGVYYGHSSLLTNKYDIVRGINPRHQDELTPLDYVNVYSGKEFWSWLNDDEEETQVWVLEGIAAGAHEYKRQNPDVAEWLSNGPEYLRDALKKAYGLPADDSLDFFLLLHAVNDRPPTD